MIVVPVAKPWVDAGVLAGKAAILAKAAAGMGGMVEIHGLAASDEEAAAAEAFAADRLSVVVHRYTPGDGGAVPEDAWDAFAEAIVEACGRAKDSGAKHLPWLIVSGGLPEGVAE